MTKADYDELKKAKARGAQYATFSNDGRLVELLMYIPNCDEEGSINIAAAIAEYERAQEGKA